MFWVDWQLDSMKGMLELDPSERNLKWWMESAGIKMFLPWGFAGTQFASFWISRIRVVEGGVEKKGASCSLARGNNYLELHFIEAERDLISISLTCVGIQTCESSFLCVYLVFFDWGASLKHNSQIPSNT